MMCPNCEEGTFNKIVFKKDGTKASLCDTCGLVWFKDETISSTTGHPIQAYAQNGEMDYTLVEIDETSEESKPVQYPTF